MVSKHHKRSIYVEAGIYDGIRKESERLGRSVSWVLLRAWKIARKDIEAIKSDCEDVKEGERFE